MHNVPSHRKLLLCLLLAALIWHLPAPRDEAGVPLDQGLHLLALFAATVVGFLTRALPMGAMVVLALVTAAGLGVLGFDQTLTGFADETVWLVVASFLLAGNVVRSGLGRRLALTLVVKLGRTPRGLAYALCGSELLLGTLIPSNTARGGGILAPIVKSLALALGSEPAASPRTAGAYLTLVGAHANLVSSAMFLTGMAANPLIRAAAWDVYGLDFSWSTWFVGALVPGLISMALLPYLIGWLEPANARDVSLARASASVQLAEAGAWTKAEKTMAAVGAALVLLWMTKPIHGLGAALVAWLGVTALLLLGTERWSDVLENTGAWDALFWVGGLLTMATHLRDLGVVGWFATTVRHAVQDLPAATAMGALMLVYFYSMYGFSMLTAHIAAMVGAFLGVAKLGGAPPLVAVAAFAYLSNLCACLTPYGSGPVIIYFAQGYVSSNRWFVIGFVVSLAHLAVWLGAGALWWKALGWW